MTDSIAIECQCGVIRGTVSPASPQIGNHLVCYCDDCQAFADFLDKDSGTLDSLGGTEIFQISPAHVSFSEGKERLACVRLTEKGPLRWYADCCRTPIGNTLATGAIPFLGLIHRCLKKDNDSLDDVLGPIRARVMARYARGPVDGLEHVHDGFNLGSMGWVFSRMLLWRLRGGPWALTVLRCKQR